MCSLCTNEPPQSYSRAGMEAVNYALWKQTMRNLVIKCDDGEIVWFNLHPCELIKTGEADVLAAPLTKYTVSRTE